MRMKKYQLAALTEESVIFLSVVKWVVLASVIGAVIGVAAAFFLKLLSYCQSVTQTYELYFLFLPLVFAVTYWITRTISPDSEGLGTEKVIQSVHQKSGDLRFRVIPVKIFTTALTIMFGGSVGKEGPFALVGAAISSSVSKWLRFSDADRKKLVICGISAGFASIFGTPVAGAIFGVEVLFVGTLLYEVLLPSFIAGMVSYQVALMMGVEYHYFSMPTLPDFSIIFLFKVVLAGLIFGIISIFFIEGLKFVRRQSNKLRFPWATKPVTGGGLLIVMGWFFSDRYFGLGSQVITDVMNGGVFYWYDFIMKGISTIITLSFGGSGGVLTPIFFIGVTSGAVVAGWLALSPILVASYGFVSVLAGAANTPIAACILAVEMFGSDFAPMATICCVISFLMSGYHSIFDSQIIKMKKSPVFEDDCDSDMGHHESHYNFQSRRKMAKGWRLARKFRIFKSR